MKALLNWVAAAASLIGLFFTLQPIADSLTPWQTVIVMIVIIVFSAAAIRDISEERRKAAKTYKDTTAINNYMYNMLKTSGRCEICSRDASWIKDVRIFNVLKEKSRSGDLTFLVHKCTEQVAELQALGAEVIEYGTLGFDPITRFTIANSGNPSSSYVAIGRRKPGELHTIEELDSSHPTHSMALDLIRSIRVANDNSKRK